MGKFEICKTNTGVVFHLKAANGEVIATSQVYSSVEACLKGVESVRHNSTAPIEDQTAEKIEEQKNPKFEVYRDKGEEFRFRLRASNGQEVAASQKYKEKSGCLKGIESIKKNAPEAEIVHREGE